MPRRRSGWTGGALCRSSRLTFDTVGKTLKAGKAVVIVKRSIALLKGKPTLVAWY